jgi:hypothetical protein
MKPSMKINLLFLIFGIPLFLYSGAPKEINETVNDYSWDIRPFGKLSYWSEETRPLGNNLKPGNLIKVPQTSENEWSVGVSWEEERDINQIEITYDGKISESLLKGTKIQYWFRTWPGPAPRSHTIEDPFDDPWQGKWLTAESFFQQENNKVTYSFAPVTKNENELAGNLPEPVNYRRTLKIRMIYSTNPLPVRSLRIFSPTNGKRISLRLEFNCDKTQEINPESKLEVYNGWIEKVKGWNFDGRDKLLTKNSWKISSNNKPKGIIADLRVAVPTLTGSNDLTIVTVRSDNGTFSFLVDDLEKGPIYIPAFSAYISYASDNNTFAASNIIKGETVREKLKHEPEQTFDRAGREIPKLSVMLREDGSKLYLPLAADASWQKFGFEWGGGFFMNKSSTKAKGRELERCNWKGNALSWQIGTGKEPVYIRDDKTSHMSILSDYLPVTEVSWNHEGLIFREEGFVTLLEGPLSPFDPGRDEQTPAVLMVKLNISNPANDDKVAHVWLKANSLENPYLNDLFILDQINGKSFIRAKIKLPEGITAADARIEQNTLPISFGVSANQNITIFLYVPFPGDLTETFKEKFSLLDYNTELNRVTSYWRNIVNDFTPFNVPERKFNEMSRSVITHIRMSATKDPKSGLFMVPAATFGYHVFANEAAFQTVFLDRIGDHKTAAEYLETFLRLQGSVPMPGTFTGDQSAVFHGTKVDEEYDYTAHKYNLDHGTLLWALGLHYLLTNDNNWLKRVSPNMLKASEWIIEQRNLTKQKDDLGVPVIHYGLLPAGHLEDNADWGFWFAVNAYAWLGLNTTAEAFKKAGLAEAEKQKKEADSYLSDLKSSVKRSSELSPVVRLKNNTYVPYVPSRAYQRFRYFGPMKEEYYKRYGKNTSVTFRLSATREALYGPLILISTGVLDPHDPLSNSILDDWEDNITISGSLGQHIHGIVDDEYWFSRGGMVFQPNLQNPIQAYLLRNEIPAAIRSIYNSMASCFYPDVNAFTEEYRRWSIGSGPMYKIPDEARFVNRVCDMLIFEVDDELWLAPGTPKNWLEPGKIIHLFNTATVYGNISYELKCGKKPYTVEANIDIPENIPEGKIKLFVNTPFEKPIKSVIINGNDWKKYDQGKNVVILPVQSDIINVSVSY